MRRLRLVQRRAGGEVERVAPTSGPAHQLGASAVPVGAALQIGLQHQPGWGEGYRGQGNLK